MPWVPTTNAATRRLINEILLKEERDVDLEGQPTSHFELYVRATEECGVDTATIHRMVAVVAAGRSISQALDATQMPDLVRHFVETTFNIIRQGQSYSGFQDCLWVWAYFLEMEAYSLDLRERVAAACAQPGRMVPAVATQFSVSVSFVEKLLHRQRTTGSVAALPPRSGPAPDLDARAREEVRACLRQEPDATLAELRTWLAALGGPAVS